MEKQEKREENMQEKKNRKKNKNKTKVEEKVRQDHKRMQKAPPLKMRALNPYNQICAMEV